LKVIVGTESYAETKNDGIDLSSLETTLRGPYPNPFDREATIEYVLSSSQEVTIEIYDVLGRRIRTLVDGQKEAGRHTIQWNGESRYGTEVGSGMYFCRMRAADETVTKKIVRVR
jgi:flagellar hook assembly protein FlgD